MSPFDDEDDGNLPEHTVKEEGERLVNLRGMLADSVISADEKAGILLVGESVSAEIDGKAVPAVEYENCTYVMDSRFGLIKL
jgi:hypothetical protein